MPFDWIIALQLFANVYFLIQAEFTCAAHLFLGSLFSFQCFLNSTIRYIIMQYCIKQMQNWFQLFYFGYFMWHLHLTILCFTS